MVSKSHADLCKSNLTLHQSVCVTYFPKIKETGLGIEVLIFQSDSTQVSNFSEVFLLLKRKYIAISKDRFVFIISMKTKPS